MTEEGLRMEEAEKGSSVSLSYIGEDKNKNLRTRVESPYGAGVEIKEGNRELSGFQETARLALQKYEKMKNSLSSGMLKSLEEEGLNAEEAAVSLVEENVRHILENREKKREDLEKQVESLSEDRREIERISASLQSERGREVADRLQKRGLPVTKANIEKLSFGMEMADKAIEKLDEAAIYHVIRNDLSETVENLLKMEDFIAPDFSGETAEKEKIWEGMKAKAKELLFNQGVEKTEENEEAARWLFFHELPVDAGNLARYRSLHSVMNTKESPSEREGVYRDLTKKVASCEDCLSVDVGTEKLLRARQGIYYFHTVVETKPLFQETKARRQIEEIRLKLTEEVAVRMMKKGIKISLTDLEGLVENLRKEEEAFFVGYLEEGRAEIEEKQELSSSIEVFQSTLSIRSYHFRLQEEGVYHYEALSATYKTEAKLSLSAYHRAGLAYEMGGTEIRRDLGDSVKKAFSQIGDFLEKNGFAVTEANQRAARLLAYQNVEINGENLSKMKRLSLLTEEVFYEMKPATVARLIRKGENPLDLPMEELYEKLKEINEEIKPEAERFSTFLFKLEKEGDMKKEEREAFIGIYRLLHQIEKKDGEAISAAAFSEKKYSLRTLLEMVRTKKLSGFNVKLDEDFGEILSSKTSGNKIDSQVERAFSSLLAARLKRELSEADTAYLKEKEKVLKEGEANLSDMEKLLETGEKISLSTAMAQMEIRGGRKNLKAFLGSFGSEEKEELREAALSFLEGFEEAERREEGFSSLNEIIAKKIKEDEEKEESYQGMKQLMSVRKTLALSVKRKNVETYDLPLFYGENGHADLSLTIRRAKGRKEGGRADIRLSLSETEISLSLHLAGTRLSGMFFAEDREKLDRLKEGRKHFSAILSDLGLSEGEVSYHLGRKTDRILTSDELFYEKSDTKLLYELAKRVSITLLKDFDIR